MFQFLQHLFRVDKVLYGIERSKEWPEVRKEVIKENPFCAYCTSKTKLEVHHIKPYHKAPELELNKDNLIVLCRPHHFEVGHFYSWVSYNENVIHDIIEWRKRVTNRP